MTTQVKVPAISLVLALGAVGALTLGLCQAAGATKTRSQRTTPLVSQEIFEQGSNGFLIKVSVIDRRRLELTATRLGQGLTVEGATYKMPIRSRPDPDEIKARFGRLGRVEMRFSPEAVSRVPADSNCKGDDVVEEEGPWTGFLSFNGEAGFTEVHVHSAYGAVVKVPALVCHSGSAPHPSRRGHRSGASAAGAGRQDERGAGREGDTQALVLSANARDHRITFLASRLAVGRPGNRFSLANLIVTGTRRRGRIEETGNVAAALEPGSYFRPIDATDPTAEAIVKPHAPFSGSATYRDPPAGPPTWSGDLKVGLPGFGLVRLTGTGTHAKICEAHDRDCVSRLGGDARPLLERLLRR